MPGAFGPMPSGVRPVNNISTSLDDYVKKLDEKIAELEREEAAEKARLEENNKISVNDKTKSESEITNEINDILKDKKEEKIIPTKANYFETIEPLPSENNSHIETKEEVKNPIVEKPKVNVDVDSVVVNNKPNNDDFFDDFFGGEDE